MLQSVAVTSAATLVPTAVLAAPYVNATHTEKVCGVSIARVSGNAPNLASLIEAHRKAKAAADAVYVEYTELCDKNPLPEIKVVIGRDYYTKEPCQWASSDSAIDRAVQERCNIPIGGQAAKDAYIRWGEKKKVELRALLAEYGRLERECGLDVMYDRVDTADDAEHDALNKFAEAVPAGMDDVRLKAQYLTEIHEGNPDRLVGGGFDLFCRGGGIMNLFALPPALTRDTFANRKLSLVPVRGDGMTPTLRGDWDYVLAAPVDRFLYDSLYVVDMHGTPLVYRCQGGPGGHVTMIKDNEAYGKTPGDRSNDLTADQFNEIVLGIVVCDLKVRDTRLLREAVGTAQQGL